MLILIDFYAENPIVGKTLQSCSFVYGTLNNNVVNNTYLENGNTYKTITGNGIDFLTINSNGQRLKFESIDSDIRFVTNNEYDLYSSSLRVWNTVETNYTTPYFSISNPNQDSYTEIDSNFIWLGQPKLGYSVPTQHPTLFNINTTVRTNDSALVVKNNVNNAVTLSFENIANNCSVIFNVGGSVILPEASKVKIFGGISNQVLTTDGSGNLSWTTPSSGGLTTSNFVFNEIPVGLINNVNLNYTLAFIPQANTVQVFVNGLLQKPTTDYTVIGSTLSFVAPLQTGDELLVHYIK